MPSGVGLITTELLAVTHVAVTVCVLELHQEEVKVTVIVEYHPLGACHSYPLAVFVSTFHVLQELDGINNGLLYLFIDADITLPFLIIRVPENFLTSQLHVHQDEKFDVSIY